MKNLQILLLVLAVTFCQAQNGIPSIAALSASVDPGGEIVTVSYNLVDNEGDACTVQLQAMVGDTVVNINTADINGDVGPDILPGGGKTVTVAVSTLPANTTALRLIADDLIEVDIQALVDQVDTTALMEHMRYVEGIRHRVTGTEHLALVKDSLQQVFGRSGLSVTRQEVPFEGYIGENIIGISPGIVTPDSMYIIDGHFDTVQDSPGADDNGSAVCGVLEAARLLGPYLFEKTISFVGFDLEEEGLLGSFEYVRLLENRMAVLGVLNLEMIGYYSDEVGSQTIPPGFAQAFQNAVAEIMAQQNRGNFLTNVGSENGATWMETFAGHAATYVPDLRVINLASPSNGLLIPDLARSDHAAFWFADIPAVMLTDGAEFRNPNYHSPRDRSETLDFTFMSQVVAATIATLAEEAGIRHASAATVEVALPVSTLEVNPLHAVEVRYLRGQPVLAVPVDMLPVQAELFSIDGTRVCETFITVTRTDLSALGQSATSGIHLLRLTEGKHTITKKVWLP